jgi:hypothetical protein
MTPKTPQCRVFWALLSSFEHSGVPEDSKIPNFGSVGLHPHTWPKWGCDKLGSAHQKAMSFTVVVRLFVSLWDETNLNAEKEGAM